MAGPILLAGALTWLIGGVSGLIVAASATEAIESFLPPLSIDTDALRATMVAIALGFLALGLSHVAVLIGLRARRRWGSTAAILLSGFLAAVFVALAAAALTSAVRTPSAAMPLIAAGAVAGAGALAYAVAVAGLVQARRSGSAF